VWLLRNRIFRLKNSKVTVLNKDLAGTMANSANNTVPNVDTEDVESGSDTKRKLNKDKLS